MKDMFLTTRNSNNSAITCKSKLTSDPILNSLSAFAQGGHDGEYQVDIIYFNKHVVFIHDSQEKTTTVWLSPLGKKWNPNSFE